MLPGTVITCLSIFLRSATYFYQAIAHSLPLSSCTLQTISRRNSVFIQILKPTADPGKGEENILSCADTLPTSVCSQPSDSCLLNSAAYCFLLPFFLPSFPAIAPKSQSHSTPFGIHYPTLILLNLSHTHPLFIQEYLVVPNNPQCVPL